MGQTNFLQEKVLEIKLWQIPGMWFASASNFESVYALPKFAWNQQEYTKYKSKANHGK